MSRRYSAFSPALSFEVLSLFHLRRASDLSDVQRWIDPVPAFPCLQSGPSCSCCFQESTWLYECRRLRWPGPWPKVAILALLLIAPFAALTGKRMRAIRRSSAEASKMMKPEVLRRLQFILADWKRLDWSSLTACFGSICLRMVRVVALHSHSCGNECHLTKHGKASADIDTNP
jgi:hypothetical protein